MCTVDHQKKDPGHAAKHKWPQDPWWARKLTDRAQQDKLRNGDLEPINPQTLFPNMPGGLFYYTKSFLKFAFNPACTKMQKKWWSPFEMLAFKQNFIPWTIAELLSMGYTILWFHVGDFWNHKEAL